MNSKVCSVDGCEREAKALGWCGKHYQRFRATGSPVATKKTVRDDLNEPCSIGGCNRPYYARGWCEMHYARFGRHGDPEKVLNGPYGQGWVNNNGYRMIRVDGHAMPEHRHVMEGVLDRPLRDQEVVHHKNGDKLDNRPENLELMGWPEHSKHHHPFTETCRRGHPWTPESTNWYRPGKRSCRICKRNYMREYNRTRRARAREASGP